MKKAAAFLLSILLLTFSWANTAYGEPEKKEEGLVLYAKSAVLLDGDSGRVLYEKNGEEILPMASTTKIMTCILALEKGNLEDVVTVSSYAAGQPQVRLGMHSGQKFYLRDLLHSLMLESHNDSAVAIAEHIAGSVEQFAEWMNEKAREIGCQNTLFLTPNGLDAQKTNEDGTVSFHSTTARDLALIMRYCAWESEKKEDFLSITRKESYHFSDCQGKGNYVCQNHNALLHMIDGALTGKTGFTGTAGYCYVGALEREGKRLVAVVLACGWPPHKTYKWSDTKKLLEYGLKEYQKRTVGMDGKVTVSVPVWSGKQKAVTAEVYLQKKEVLLKKTEQIDFSYSLPKLISAPIKEKEQIGTFFYRLGDENIYEQPFYARTSIEHSDGNSKFWKFWQDLFFGAE